MAPTKNSHSNCSNNTGQYTPNSNNSSDHNNSTGSQHNAGAVNASGSTGHTHKKHTGTVPKVTAPVQRMEREGASQQTKTATATNVAPPVASAGIKTGKSTSKRSAASLLQQQKQLQQQPLAHGLFATERASPFNIVTSTQQQQQQQHQQQQQQQQHHQQQQHQRKNTEIVAPIRRELKDLNDYLLSAVATTNNSSQQQIHAQQQHQFKQHNYSKCQQPQQQQQVNENNAATSGGIDIETIPDSQSRFCYPVRPIPRRNLQQTDSTNDYNNSYSTVTASASTAATTSNLNQLNHPAAVGVVIPTTPSIVHNTNISASINDEIAANNHLTDVTTRSINCNNNTNTNTTINQQQLLLLQQLQHQIEEQSSLLLAASYHQQQQQPRSPNLLDIATNSLTAATSNTQSSSAHVAANDINLLQRLQLIQQILSLSSKPNLAAVPAVQISAIPTQQQCNKAQNMVNEVRSPTATERDIIVNSNSLEDVALSEVSDNRAQSIQSLHSAHEETPTPDNTPGYDELQQRLEASNRNILNIQEQQQQLLRLQQQAKQHLNEMEALRHQAPTLSFGQQNGGNPNDPPEYQSIEQVHSDMSALVGRMKNLTTFIQHQNDLGNLLGDDGPDILAEQEALQRKLESLRVQRDEMRSLVGELQDINRHAERTAEQRRLENEQQQQQQQEEPPVVPTDTTVTATPPPATTTHRVVPVEYSRIVPIELLQAATAQFPATEPGEDPAAAEMMRQKVADIALMKAQLKRLKDMMQTVNFIEEHTLRTEPKDIGRNVPVNNAVDVPVQRERSCSYDRDRTPTASDGNEENNDFMSAKVRMLNEVTSDLRAQALSLQAERDRIKALKEEIVRRKAEAAAAAQVNDDALKRNTTQLMQRRQEQEQGERDLLKEEYEVKKKEFEELCQRLQLDNVCHTSTPTTAQRPRINGTHDIVSEADDEAEVEEELNDSDFGAVTTTAAANKYFAAQSCNSEQPVAKHATSTASPAAAPNQRNDKHIIEESSATAAPANTTHDTAASLEAASMQSGSSQSYSMPPPMHQLSGPPTSSWLPGPIPPPLPTSWNPHLYYGGAASSQPFSTQFTPTHFSGIHGSVAGLHPQHHPPAPSSADCICSASNSASTLGAAVNVTAAGTTAGSAAPITADPMLLQQFVQTQQMLINSVCQCNQMLWHQQREIDALNNTIHMLQDRLLTLAGPSSADLAFNIRSESVPPPTSLSGAIHSNNVYATLQNRAQSEQPTGFLPLPRGSAFSNYHQQQQHLYQQRQQRSAGGYNYATELQQHQQQNASSTASIFTTLNNAAPPPPPQFNNEAPQSPMTAAGPGPIFMHHHNNTIHQNNANLRTQNQHANNLQQQQQPHSNIAVNGGGSTLNNQVPPGNRANNYWDNFRSYSRQNLLSTNSNKSNEDQNQQHMQQQQLQQQYQTPHILPLPELPQEQQLPQQAQHLYSTQRQINQQNSSSNDCNNLNYDRNNSGGGVNSNNNNANCNKYLSSMQRSRINQLQQQQQQQLVAANMLSSVNAANNIYQANLPSSSARELLENLNWHDNVGVEDDSNIFDNYNISANDMSATYAGIARNMNTNMNLNFGNNMQYQRNKVPAKPACQGATLHRGNLQHTAVQQPYLNVAEGQRYDLLTAGVTTTTSSPLQRPQTTVAATSVSAGTSTNNPRNRERDYLLCTVDMATGYNYAPSAPAIDDFAAENSLATANVNEDTTSEEIKRNLLVNALKNDKFTTKFYESIKEDVFRRLESLLLEKDTVEPSHSSSSTQQQCLLNDMDSVARYPTRKLYLNEQMGNQQQQQPQQQQTPSSPTGNQQQQQQQQQPLPLSQQINQELNVAEAYCDKNNAEEAESNNAEETESNNADENDLSSTSQATAVAENVCDVAASLENEEPEENENLTHNMTASTTSLRTATVLNTSSSPMNEVHPATNRTTIPSEQLRPLVAIDSNTSSKKRKNQRQHRNNVSDATLNSDSGALVLEELQSRTTTNPNNNYNKLYENDSTDSELVNYIITRIYNQTPANTLINDTLLVEIAKLTAAAVQISTSKNLAGSTTADGSSSTAIQQQQLIISPKKLYAKIRKKSIPRQRDEFLAWYQGYLEGFLFVNNHNHTQNNNNSSKQAVTEKKLPQRNKQPQQVAGEGKLANTNTSSNNKPQVLKLQNSTPATVTKTNCNNNNNNIQVNADNLDINDADLAEADQICSANTSSNTSNTLPHNEDVANIDHINFIDGNEKNDDVSSDNQVDELENNENPEEEGATACSVLLEKHDAIAEEKQQKDESNIASTITTTITVADFNINDQDFAALTTSSNSDNTEDTSNNSSGRAKKSKQEFHKRNSVA